MSDFTERLRNRDDSVWDLVQAETLPRVRAALERQYGKDRRWVDVDGCVQSALRVVLADLQRWEDKMQERADAGTFFAWLLGTAKNKLRQARRKSGTEERHQPAVGVHDQALHQVSEECLLEMADTIAFVCGSLENDEERIVIQGLMQGQTWTQIAAALVQGGGRERCAASTAFRIGQQIKARFRTEGPSADEASVTGNDEEETGHVEC